MQEKLRHAQEELELRQREEEQALLTKFQQEREVVESTVKEETEHEWEDRLKNITQQLDKQYKKKHGKEYEEVNKKHGMQFLMSSTCMVLPKLLDYKIPKALGNVYVIAADLYVEHLPRPKLLCHK